MVTGLGTLISSSTITADLENYFPVLQGGNIPPLLSTLLDLDITSGNGLSMNWSWSFPVDASLQANIEFSDGSNEAYLEEGNTEDGGWGTITGNTYTLDTTGNPIIKMMQPKILR